MIQILQTYFFEIIEYLLHNQRNFIQKKSVEQIKAQIEVNIANLMKISKQEFKLYIFFKFKNQTILIYRITKENLMQFPTGQIYLIICAQGDKALKIQNTLSMGFEKSRITYANPNPNDDGQLFLIEKVGNKDDEFQIINCVSDLVFDEQSKQIRLKRGKRSGDQLFSIQKAKVQGKFPLVNIKTKSDGKVALQLEGILRYKPFDENKINQVFRLAPLNFQHNQTLATSCAIVNKGSQKSLDIPEGSFKKGERIIQYTKNFRFNQRWRFIPKGQGCLIQNLLNGLVLDIAEQKKEGGSQVVQWEITEKSNQLWKLEPAGQGVFKIKSCLCPMYLCIKDQSIEDGGKLQIWDKQNITMFWFIYGSIPK